MTYRDRLRLWVADLRRDDIEQGKGYLTQIVDGVRKDCCLGRACQVALENGALGEPIIRVDAEAGPAPRRTLFEWGRQRTYFMLPDEVAFWYGIEPDPLLLTGYNDGDWTEERAACLNDTYDWSFADIADAIERTFGL